MQTSKDIFQEQMEAQNGDLDITQQQMVYDQEEEFTLTDNAPVLTATDKLQLFQTNKNERSQLVGELMTAIEQGDIDPLKVHIQFKCMEELIFQLTSTDEKKNKEGFEIAKKYKKYLQEAAEKFAEGQKSFSFLNAKVEIKEVGVKYDYSNCGDSEMDFLLIQQQVIDEKVKARAKFLQTLPEKGLDIFNPDGGEVMKVYRPAKTSTTSIAVSLK